MDGWCYPAFGPVREAFAENFTHGDEVGAAVCVVVDGRRVVDLWGGWADEARTRPWQPDTLVNFYSIGKGLSALLVARLAGQGLLEVTAPVARYWPDFAAGGKDTVTVAQLLSHQAGLPAVRHRLPPGAMLHHDVMATALAAEAPWWEPGSAHGYHVNTFGFLVGELVRRVTGKTLGTLLRDDIAGPLDADVHIGLPAAELSRVAEVLTDGPAPAEAQPEGLSAHELMNYNAYFNPSGLSGVGLVNSRAWRMAEVPGTNGQGSARGVARVYTALAAGGCLDGLTVVEPDALAAATVEHAYGDDLILGRPSRFGLGFQLTQPERPLGPNPTAFGHYGAGGSLAFCDPEAGLAFGYVMNRTESGWRNPRNRTLLDATYVCMA